MPWNADALFAYLRNGWHSDHGVARGPMTLVVSNLSEVPDSDVRAIATYMASVFGAQSPDRKRQVDQALARARSPPAQASKIDPAGAAIYAPACPTCHEAARPSPYGAGTLPSPPLTSRPRSPTAPSY